MHENRRSVEELIVSHKPGYALDQRFYTDPEVYALEIERVVSRNWIVAGHQSELPQPGDFKVLNVANDSAIIVRGSDGELKAFANVCRHRGSLVCLEAAGNARKFSCPYHGWMYDIDGNLTAARSMPEDFDNSQYALNRVSLDTLGGLMLVCFSDNPPRLDGAKRDLAEPLAIFDFENLKVAAHKDYAIPANWKLAIENYQECYHCATAHPEYAQMHTLMVDRRKREPLQKNMLGRMEDCGIRKIEIDKIDLNAPPGEMGYGYSRTALFEGYLTGSKGGKPVAPLLGDIKDYDGGGSDFVIGAFSFLLVYSDHAVVYVFTPVDMHNCKCDIYWLVRKGAEEGKDYDVDELIWLWDVTTEADKTIIVNNWKGVQSRYYKPGPFSGMESAEQMWTEWIVQELARG
ncbi:MAG: aromatic ring-hydroxylating dioxygenase subunit alpha [Gammaproteobacteria bacterium]|nr:aromatic ring-hydroxylating dioxygenase subunit alpha [Gammaproteobacteria bacterium]MDH3409739.1 aromatic ring-hydroxylating dioxygenase subunit alpha [Gammaproteobacteria bacterium]MDH3551719.1 aromatic ring-hydroxylating dioxygenase subunit alpha [Gammaproteobacteria bacterium]